MWYISINAILFSKKEKKERKKQSTGRCYNMDEPWKHYAKWKNPVTKDYILYDSIDKMSTTDKSSETDSKLMGAEDWS